MKSIAILETIVCLLHNVIQIELNKAIGSVQIQHTKGEAVDIEIPV